MIKAGIIGGAGYTAGELIRLLIGHPDAEPVLVQSKSHAGEKLFAAHADLEGQTELVFTDQIPENMDVIFLCSGHGRSVGLYPDLIKKGNKKIIDLSADFRLKDAGHDFIYGLPELNIEEIKKADHVANPGCFATCIQLSLLPLAKAGLLSADVHVSAITGSTGAGQALSETTHFSWRSNNASVYKPLKHQHVAEITQSLKQLQRSFENRLQFIPMRGAFTRGILASAYSECGLSLDELEELYQNYYKEHPFVQVTDTSPDLKRVVNTNNAFIHVHKEDGQVVITGVIDNLLKGASGQAVQNMNLMFGLDEQTGLKLKSGAF